MLARALRDFDGNYERISMLMQESWKENHEQPLQYSADILASAFKYPGASFGTAPMLMENDKVIAFGAGFPRRVQYVGEEWMLLLDSFITVASGHKGQGLGGAIWGNIAERARDRNYDGLITFCVEGDRMNQVLLRFSDHFGYLTERVFTISYMGLPIARDTRADLAPECDPTSLLDAALYASPAEFHRMWSEEEAVWQCETRAGAISAMMRTETRVGAITGYIMATTSASNSVRCCLLEDILWNGFNVAERGQLLRMFLGKAASRDVQFVLCPILNYADLSPLVAAGFRRSKRQLHMYLTAFNVELPLRQLSSVYIDPF